MKTMIEIKKTRNEWIIETIVILAVIIVQTVVYLSIPSLVMFLYCMLFTIFVIRIQIERGRILKMDQDSYAISFMGIKRQYKWDELTIKRIEYHKNIRLVFLPYKLKYVVFSPKCIYKKGRWRADIYSALVHPFSVSYIYLIPQKMMKESGDSIHSYLAYAIEEELFMKKMSNDSYGKNESDIV